MLELPPTPLKNSRPDTYIHILGRVPDHAIEAEVPTLPGGEGGALGSVCDLAGRPGAASCVWAGFVVVVVDVVKTTHYFIEQIACRPLASSYCT